MNDITENCEIVDFKLSGLVTPEKARELASDANLPFKFQDIKPEAAISRWANHRWKSNGASFEGALAFEDDQYMVIGICKLEKVGKQKAGRKQRASLVYEKANDTLSVKNDSNEDDVAAACQFFKEYIEKKMAFKSHHDLRVLIVRYLENQIGAARLVPERSSSFLVTPDMIPDVENLFNGFAVKALQNSRLYRIKIDASSESTKENLQDAAKNSLTQSLLTLEEEIQTFSKSDKTVRPSTLHKRLTAIKKMEARVSQYENALNFKFEGLYEGLDSLKSQANEMMLTLTESK